MLPIPLLSKKPIHEMLAGEFRQKIRKQKLNYLASQEIKKKKRAVAQKKSTSPIEGVHFRFNKKGTPIFTFRVRKEPKWLSPNEIDILAVHHGVPKSQMWVMVRQKGIKVSNSEIEQSIEEIPWQ